MWWTSDCCVEAWSAEGVTGWFCDFEMDGLLASGKACRPGCSSFVFSCLCVRVLCLSKLWLGLVCSGGRGDGMSGWALLGLLEGLCVCVCVCVA